MHEGDSLDMYCANLALGYEAYLRNKDDPNTLTKQFSQEELKSMVARVKGKNERKSKKQQDV
jgi:hypothetical protein